MSDNNQSRLLLVVIHPENFVWRITGTIMLYRATDWRFKVVCARYGEKGEDSLLSKESSANLQSWDCDRMALQQVFPAIFNLFALLKLC